jgi:hypothetical protein
MEFTPASDIDQEFTLFIAGIIRGQGYILGGELDANNRRIYLDNFEVLRIAFGATAALTLNNSDVLAIQSQSGNVHEFNLNGASSSYIVDDGESYDSGTINVGTNNLPSSNPTRLFQYGSANTLGTYSMIMHVVMASGSMSTADQDKLQGFLAHEMSQQSKLPAAHPYKTLPPFS